MTEDMNTDILSHIKAQPDILETIESPLTSTDKENKTTIL